MPFFFIVIFALYGALHYYIFVKVRDAFSPGIGTILALLAWMLFMVAAPLLVYYSEKQGLFSLAPLLAYIGYLWMGFAFLFFSASVLLDIYRLLAYFAGWVFPFRLPSPSPSWRFLLPLVISLTTGTYGYFEALHIRTERVILKTSKIPKELSPVRIVQISDVHLGMIVREERLSRILREVKKANPDLFVSTGDLVDAQVNRLNHLSDLLGEIRPRWGKFAVTGNHEYYAGLAESLEFTRQAGFRVLRGEGLTVGGCLNLAGVDDPTGQAFGEAPGIPEPEMLARLPRDRFTLLLKHRPVLDPSSMGHFDLQVSGHTHKGQILPFRLGTRIFFPFMGGLYRFPDGFLLYTSRGTGTWGPPIRFLTPPEVTLYELTYEEKN
jgi:predicted MPP superfamily phosphohydrolase